MKNILKIFLVGLATTIVRIIGQLSIPAGEHCWKMPGNRERPRHGTATPGASLHRDRKVLSTGVRRSMPDRVTDGSIRCMKCWSGSARAHRERSSQQRAYKWTTFPTRPNPGDSTSRFWNSRCRKPRRMTGICIILVGNTCTNSAGMTASAL